MVYKFQEIEITKKDTLVRFTKSSPAGKFKSLSVPAEHFLSGEFNKDNRITSPEMAKAAAQVIFHDFVLPERKLA